MPSQTTDNHDGIEVTATATIEYTSEELEELGLTPEVAKENLAEMVRTGELELEVTTTPLNDDRAPQRGQYHHTDLDYTFPVHVPTESTGLEIDASDHTFKAGDVLETRDEQHPDEYRVILETTDSGMILYHSHAERFSFYPVEWMDEDFDDSFSTATEYIIHPRPARCLE
jgi:leucyl aminopeptidase (aminopeptidase T)